MVAWALSSKARSPSRRETSANSTRVSMIWVLSLSCLEKATLSRGSTLSTSFMEKLTMMEAMVPPRTIMRLGRLTKSEMSPSIMMETIIKARPTIIPNMVARSMYPHSFMD